MHAVYAHAPGAERGQPGPAGLGQAPHRLGDDEALFRRGVEPRQHVLHIGMELVQADLAHHHARFGQFALAEIERIDLQAAALG